MPAPVRRLPGAAYDADVASPPAPTYAAAVEELEAILRALDSTEVDVDQLTAKVARAAELIEFCRERLAEATVDVEKIVAGMAPDARSDPATTGAERPAPTV